ncbi:hypothetical protein C0Q70_09675 [Pomacea canaliculata]|uniref:Uncharacterized protein n=1 Tax=Pomacea canaliculata TaxID=400727 RepID=A0A2T7PAG9_POMCA|nr:hypothetical protein C0Q70_09675 [Pomacea canaliculata]
MHFGCFNRLGASPAAQRSLARERREDGGVREDISGMVKGGRKEKKGQESESRVGRCSRGEDNLTAPQPLTCAHLRGAILHQPERGWCAPPHVPCQLAHAW